MTVKAPSVFTPPKTINKTCSSDDTEALGTWLLSVPNGTPGHDNIAELAKKACYTVDGEWWWRGAHNIVLDGNGATLKQGPIAPTTPWATVGGRNNPTTAPYCGSTAYMNDLYSGITTQPLLLALEGGCDITVENLTIIGTHKQGGDPAPSAFYQPASFISLYGAQRVLIDHVTEKGPYGDFVTIDGFHEAPGGGGGYPSTDVTIEHCNFSAAGRAGVSETNGAHRVLVEDTAISGAALDVFDIEQDVDYAFPVETDIDITHDTISGPHYGYLLSAETGSEVQRVAFTDNKLIDGAQMRILVKPYAPTPGASNSFVVEGNTDRVATTWPVGSPVIVYNMTPASVLVADNVDPVPTYGGTGLPFATIPKGGLACGDTDPLSGEALDSGCPSVLPIVSPPLPPALPN